MDTIAMFRWFITFLYFLQKLCWAKAKQAKFLI